MKVPSSSVTERIIRVQRGLGLQVSYLEAYMRIYKRSGLSFIENQLIGYEEELFYHSLGSISEMFDGNPPFHGRGAHSFAINVAGILRTIRLLDGFNVSLNE